MTRETLIAFAVVMIPAAHGLAEDITASKIFEKVNAAYKSMDTYQAQGTVTSNIDTGGMKMDVKTSFSMILKKPNLYLYFLDSKEHADAGRVSVRSSME